jgi:N-formylglutamate amidohydrolase
MENNLLLHIPHSSINLPDIFMDRLLISQDYLQSELDILTDLYTDELFNIDGCRIVKSNYSRLFFDTERYSDDAIESMSKLGMGAIYTKTTKGDLLIKIDDEYREFVLSNFYDKHHKELENKTEEILNKFGKCINIDGHSFSKELVNTIRNTNKDDYPDFCIGYEEKFCDRKIIDVIVQAITEKGYTYAINYPYAGSIVPNKYYKEKNRNVKSVMIEINKRIYMNAETCRKSDRFDLVKQLLKEIMNKINKD